MSLGDCIFCKIVSGAVPARKVLETDDCVAFLDVAPVAPGHCLLVPRRHLDLFEQMPADLAGAVLRHLAALGKAVRTATQADGFNVLLNNGKTAGQEVMHVHVHVIPRKADDGLGYRWRPQPLDEATADALRRRIAAELGA
ncbi:MAG: HIT family protein [Planctomycetota bacterium]